MRIAIRAVVLLVLALGIPACDASGRGAVGQEHGVPYRGPVTVQILEPGRTSGSRDAGTGMAQFVDLGGGHMRLTVEGSIRKRGDAGFSLEGRRSGTGWSGASETLRMTIDDRGRISGGGTADNMRVVLGGRAIGDQLALRVELETLSANKAGGFPVGTRTIFDYALERARATSSPSTTDSETPAQDAATADLKDAEGRPCRKIVWRTRNVTTPGGGMSMIQVPHCVR